MLRSWDKWTQLHPQTIGIELSLTLSKWVTIDQKEMVLCMIHHKGEGEGFMLRIIHESWMIKIGSKTLTHSTHAKINYAHELRYDNEI